MKLEPTQLRDLLQLVANAQHDSIGCDGCAELMDLFAQAELDEKPIPPDLRAVRQHLNECKCCRDEYSALITALQAISE